MPDLPTRLDYFALGRDYVLSRAKKIDPGQVDVEGSDVNIAVGGQSVLADAVTRQLGYSVARHFLDSAEKEDLDRYVFDRYQQVRKGASPAVGTIRIFRTAVTGGSGAIPIGTKVVTLTGVEYITTTLATFAASDLTSSANVRAVQAGKSTQVGANSIRRFGDPSLIFDKSLTVTNDAATAGGEDEESDDLFRSRVRLFWTTARRGVLSAIEFGALSVAGVVSAQAVEALTSDNQPARVVNLYISDSSGVASEVLATAVREALLEYRAGGFAVIISTSIPFIVQISLKLTFTAGVDTVTLTDSIRASITEFVNSLPVNGVLRVADIYSVLRRFVDDGLVVTKESIVSPVGDLIPEVGQTLRTTLDSVTAEAA